ncbi:MAG: 3'-5' exonuclease [Flavobacteriales bacterium]|nr:3'-5' exonuclease [Flavobacteriales bacterium]|tara:strand:- start:1462 stop:2049 length:588 start_codon:yes stop_codon:yes gene_type:complete
MDYYIHKEEVSKYPIIMFDGEINLIETKKDVIKYCKIISKADVVGFDTETKPAFQKGVSYNISLLQLSVKDSVFLFRIDKVGFMQEIEDLLSSPDITKVGIDIKNDISGLKKIKSFEPYNFIDLNSVALKCGFKSIGAVKLSIMLLGFRVSKKQRLSDWSSHQLTEAQKKYAAIDAWICPKILNVFQKRFPRYFE